MFFFAPTFYPPPPPPSSIHPPPPHPFMTSQIDKQEVLLTYVDYVR